MIREEAFHVSKIEGDLSGMGSSGDIIPPSVTVTAETRTGLKTQFVVRSDDRPYIGQRVDVKHTLPST